MATQEGGAEPLEHGRTELAGGLRYLSSWGGEGCPKQNVVWGGWLCEGHRDRFGYSSKGNGEPCEALKRECCDLICTLERSLTVENLF